MFSHRYMNENENEKKEHSKNFFIIDFNELFENI